MAYLVLEQRIARLECVLAAVFHLATKVSVAGTRGLYTIAQLKLGETYAGAEGYRGEEIVMATFY